MQELPDAEILS
jgi:hypothetical protein